MVAMAEDRQKEFGGGDDSDSYPSSGSYGS